MINTQFWLRFEGVDAEGLITRAIATGLLGAPSTGEVRVDAKPADSSVPLPELARVADDSDSLTYLRLTGTSPTRELVIIRHLQRYQSRGAEQFLSLLREAVRAREKNGVAPK